MVPHPLVRVVLEAVGREVLDPDAGVLSEEPPQQRPAVGAALVQEDDDLPGDVAQQALQEPHEVGLPEGAPHLQVEVELPRVGHTAHHVDPSPPPHGVRQDGRLPRGGPMCIPPGG